MSKDLTATETPRPLVDVDQADQIVSVLGMLIDQVGSDSLLAMVLKQARMEVVSLATTVVVDTDGNTIAA